MQYVNLSRDELARVEAFCLHMSMKQCRRGSRDGMNRDRGEKRYGQGVIGKVGELAATKVVGGDIDFTVWIAGTRLAQYDADVVATAEKPKRPNFATATIHVKTTHTRFLDDWHRVSWTIDKLDPLVAGGTANDVFILMFADETGRAVAFGWVAAPAVAGFWKPCITLPHKLALYYVDIKGLIAAF